MCNIAGYIGKRDAAPILVEMMKKQEGYGGGYYTGITTHDGVKLHTAKVIGDLDNLLKETDGYHFPGKMGFLHSRSNSGGGREWGHPFTNVQGNLSYIANGSAGIFLTDEYREKSCALTTELEAGGYVFASKAKGIIGDYPALADGTSIHMSDLICQYIACLVDKGMEPDKAMSQAYSELPAEVVGLVIHEKHPDSIFASRINFPMMIGITLDGDTYLATTALAFPEDVTFRTIELLPPVTTFEIYAGGYRTSAHPIRVDNVAPITPDIWHRAYQRIEETLQNNKGTPLSVQAVIDACDDIWPSGMLQQGAPLVYEIMRALKKEGKLQVVPVQVSGAFEGYSTNNFRICIQ